MLYNGLKIGVFFKTKTWVDQWFHDFLNSIDNAYVSRYVKNGLYPYMVELRDGTKIIAYKAVDNDSGRGLRVDKAYVEPDISSEIINEIVVPMTRCERIIVEEV